MIATLEGTVSESQMLEAVIEAAGVGYQVHMPISTSGTLPPIGSKVKLFTHVVYREDQQNMYGFATREEREFFRLLVEKVSGVGPKTALALLSKLSVPMLQTALAQGDAKLLAQCPGIGKRTAERLIVELKDKVANVGIAAGVQMNGQAAAASSLSTSAQRSKDAVDALVALGYGLSVADKSVQKALKKLGDDAEIEELIKTALSS